MPNLNDSLEPDDSAEQQPQTNEVKPPTFVNEYANRVTVKAPKFTENSPVNWFRILESQFFLGGIVTSQTKFYHSLSHLPPDVLDNVSEEVIASEKYEDLREAIISFYTKTKAELFEKLISKSVMTGRPSAYLRNLQQVGTKVGASTDLIRHKFIQSLPTMLGTALAAQKSLTLNDMGKMADELMSIGDQGNSVNNLDLQAGCSSSYPEQGNADINAVDYRQNGFFSQNTYQRDYQNNGYQKNNYQRNYQRSQDIQNNVIPLGLRPFNQTQRPKICRAHLYFAEFARTCKPWCKFPGKRNNCKIQPSSRPSSPSRESQAEN